MMEKLTSMLEKYIYPVAAKFQENKFLMAIQYGMMLSTPLLKRMDVPSSTASVDGFML